ncbi:hypothetical protein ACNF49_14125 [Actinomadura sp. ATCC 39365]
MELTSAPVIEGVVILSSSSAAVVRMGTASGPAASLTSSDQPLATFGGEA